MLVDKIVIASYPHKIDKDGKRHDTLRHRHAFGAVFDMADPSQIPVITEPLFNLAKAKITLTPCMTLEDIKKVSRRRLGGCLRWKVRQGVGAFTRSG
jgi:hypothetical protein